MPVKGLDLLVLVDSGLRDLGANPASTPVSEALRHYPMSLEYSPSLLSGSPLAPGARIGQALLSSKVRVFYVALNWRRRGPGLAWSLSANPAIMGARRIGCLPFPRSATSKQIVSVNRLPPPLPCPPRFEPALLPFGASAPPSFAYGSRHCPPRRDAASL